MAIILGAYLIISQMNVEYEYSYTNGELDIDTIYSKKKRKRLLSVSCGKFEAFSPACNDNPEKDIKNKVYACSKMDSAELYYAVFALPEKGRTILYFEPSDRMVEDIKKRIPRVIQ